MFVIRHTNVCRNLSLRSLVRAYSVKGFNFDTYTAVNEPMPDYAPGTAPREKLEETLQRYDGVVKDCPIVIGDEEIRTNDVRYAVSPFDKNRQVAKYYYADEKILRKAIQNSLAARKDWERTPLAKRAEVFMKAAELMSEKYRYDLLATTMLGQGKNIWQAEIDAAAELIDFLRFNVQFAREMTEYQPLSPKPEVETNRLRYRGMEGFWAAITPFNFTAIGGHLCSAPALMGNVCLWKPSDTAVLSNYTVYNIFREAGLPAGVINFVTADGPVFGNTITNSSHLAGINFTGSVKTFKTLQKMVANNLDIYRSYPRMLGECGGKNMHFIHKSADPENVIYGSILSGFEYSGQKCSALSRMYVPQSMWPKIKEGMLKVQKQMKLGSPLNGETFLSAVIDDRSFERNKTFLEHAKKSDNCKILAGGNCDDSKGYFVEPTIIETKDPQDKLMREEIFGPVVTVYPYPDDEYIQVARQANETSPFALTGAIYANDQEALDELVDVLHDAAGNVYVNEKSTGSVVGQQPFGGGRLSGTNDKAGGPFYLLKFVSPQSVKTGHQTRTTWTVPSMAPNVKLNA